MNTPHVRQACQPDITSCQPGKADAPVDQIVNAVLYEGYVLYPYRPSVKNRQRWTFGGLYPRACSDANAGSDPWLMRIECIVRGDEHSTLHVTVGFLHLIDRRIKRMANASPEMVDSLDVDGRRYQSWQESVERKITLQPCRLGDAPVEQSFSWPAQRWEEPIRNAAENHVGAIVRTQQEIAGRILVFTDKVGHGLFRLCVRIENDTPFEPSHPTGRDEALMHALVSTHAILDVHAGAFISQIDPPSDVSALVAGCNNIGAWPVLVGAAGTHDTMLAAPIILYDYPQIAPESPGDLFDGTEIDEILSLRILTLSEDEKRQAAATDERVRALLSRTESLDASQLAGMHGVMRPSEGMR